MTEEEKVRIFNKYKKQNREVKCIICNNYIYADNKLLFEVVVNRGSVHFFHNKCYEQELNKRW